jgi:hypothetical protein
MPMYLPTDPGIRNYRHLSSLVDLQGISKIGYFTLKKLTKSNLVLLLVLLDLHTQKILPCTCRSAWTTFFLDLCKLLIVLPYKSSLGQYTVAGVVAVL